MLFGVRMTVVNACCQFSLGNCWLIIDLIFFHKEEMGLKICGNMEF